MKSFSSVLLIVYWVVICLDCIFIFNHLEEYRVYSKPFIVPILYAITAIETSETQHRRSKAVISLLLLFSLAGDILLLNSNDKIYFTCGLGCFFIVHVLYALFFFRIKRFSVKRIGITGLALLVIFAYQFLLLSTIWQKIKEDEFGVQVLVYCLSTALMFAGAANTTMGKRAKSTAWKFFVPAAVLFIISDSLLAIYKFYPFPAPPKDLLPLLSCGVMVTYGAAQLLFISGALKFIKK